MQNQDREIHSLIHMQSQSSIGRASMTLRELFQKSFTKMAFIKIYPDRVSELRFEYGSISTHAGINLDACVGVEVNVHWKQNGTPMEGTLLLLPKDYEGQKIIEKALSKSYEAKQDGTSWLIFHFWNPGLDQEPVDMIMYSQHQAEAMGFYISC